MNESLTSDMAIPQQRYHLQEDNRKRNVLYMTTILFVNSFLFMRPYYVHIYIEFTKWTCNYTDIHRELATEIIK